MLHAILEGKAGRVTIDGGEDQSWREVFRKREDLLTAVFFGRMRYLSKEGEQKVLSLLIGADLAGTLGEVREVIFWPKLRGLKDRQHVEPDVVIQFLDSLLAIEVKPPLGGEQRGEQWQKQVQSLILQRNMDDTDIDVPESFHFLALGRNMPEHKEVASDLHARYADKGLESVRTLEWSDVCHGLHALLEGAEGRDGVIYEDWLKAFSLFGLIEKPLPFSDLLKLLPSVGSDWRKRMQSLGASEAGRALPSADWQALARLCNVIKLGAAGWK